MYESFIKSLIIIIALTGIGFFILQKNLAYSQLLKDEKKMVQKIYEVEEQRRYKLYYIEKIRKDHFYKSDLNKVKVLNVDEK